MEVLEKWEVKKLSKNSILLPIGLEKDVANYLNASLNINQRALPTPYIYYNHLISTMFEQYYLPHHESRVLALGSFTVSKKWLLCYFFPYFLF